MTDRPTVLFLAPEPVHAAATGPARRALKLAEVVAAHCDVTLAAPAPSTFPEGPFRTLETEPGAGGRVAAAFAAHDISVVQTLPSPRALLAAHRRAPRLVVDLIAPLALEVSEIDGDASRRSTVVEWRARQMVSHLAAADMVLCTNERQRDLLVGAALGSGLLAASPRLHEQIAVVPHGIDADPAPRGSALRTAALSGDVSVVIWGGGIWSWLDPLTSIRAMARLRDDRPDLRLAFVGLDHPDPAQRRAHAGLRGAAEDLVRAEHLEDVVVFRPAWLSREEFVRHLADADVGLSLHTESLEGRYATRTRVLDYLEAGLRVVCTRGDTMAEVVERHGLGEVVEPGDVDGCARALDRVTREKPALAPSAALEPLRWSSVARPLVEFCLSEEAPNAALRIDAFATAARQYPAFVRAVHAERGAAEVVRAAARRAGALAGRRRR